MTIASRQEQDAWGDLSDGCYLFAGYDAKVLWKIYIGLTQIDLWEIIFVFPEEFYSEGA